ncbi:DUF4430 domain-containing protein [Candidatus Kaiserbacteria bacterium]|nr:DUF4430 domain-containing protein [Candidatus Kaiserbacteria bacterium]
MKKSHIITLALIAIFGLIALRPEGSSIPTPTQVAATAAHENATTSPDDIHVNLAPSPDSVPQASQAAANSDTTIVVGEHSYTVPIASDTSVLNAMNAAMATGMLTFTGREYPGLGFFIESLNGKKNADGFYWFLYVNGVSSDTGASQTLLHPGDTVEWRYKRNY